MEPRLDYYTASPAALRALMLLEAANFELNLEKGLVELLKLRVSQLNDCAFCADMHALQARNNGESAQRLHQLVVWQRSTLFTARERAMLAWCDAVTLLKPDDPSDALCDEVRAYFTDRELVDLTVAIATINCWNRLAVSFRNQPAQ